MAVEPYEPSRITILTGPIHSGKTTRLAAWVAEQHASGMKIDGVLAPIVDGRRHVRSIADGSSRRLELAPGEDPPAADEVRIGPHRFSGAVFAWGRRVLIAALARAQLIVIDEVGPLELRGEGMEPAVTQILAVSARTAPGQTRVVLVVREGLVDRVVEQYRLAGRHEIRHDMHD